MSIPQLSPIRQFPARLRKLAAILEVGYGAISLLPKLAKNHNELAQNHEVAAAGSLNFETLAEVSPHS